jgi:hypothetical protein
MGTTDEGESIDSRPCFCLPWLLEFSY